MQQPFDAIVTGFVKSPALATESLSALRTLRQEGVIRAIHYVTWDTPDIDPHLEPIAAMDDVQITRVPQPETPSAPNQRGIVLQIKNLEAALALIPNPDALVLKTRPDYVMKTDFLRRKLTGWESWSPVESRQSQLGVTMPAPILKNKIWLPWADCNQPFFYEDATFAGRRVDLARLVTRLQPSDMNVLADPHCGHFVHVVRFAKLFVTQYPLITTFLRNYRYFINHDAYRQNFLTLLLKEGFFWHFVFMHAWILHSQFHIDAGAQNDIRFFSNAANKNADWSNLETLRNAPPYDTIERWRSGETPGSAMAGVTRPWGRLMDDAWQKALFTQPMSDLQRPKLASLMENIARSGDGRLDELERAFYAKAAMYHRAMLPKLPAAA